MDAILTRPRAIPQGAALTEPRGGVSWIFDTSRARGVFRWSAFVLLATALCAGLSLTARHVLLRAKAGVASVLIERAFDAYRLDGEAHSPWAWADFHPVASLEAPRLGVRRVVLSGSSGSSMAFGPGHIDGTAEPNTSGNCVLVAHRDTSFAFLQDLRPGDRIVVDTRDGETLYRVTRLDVRSMWDATVLDPSIGKRLTLVTCYPFDRLLHSPLRYVVTCEALNVTRDPTVLEVAARPCVAMSGGSSEVTKQRGDEIAGEVPGSAQISRSRRAVKTACSLLCASSFLRTFCM